jgi:hypothetical protein
LRRFVAAAFLAGSVALPALGADEEPDAASRAKSLEFQKKAAEAHQRQDWPAFLVNSREALALRPGSPRLTYNLACAEARNGNAAQAARLLEGLLDRRLDMGSATDEDFASVRGSAAFVEVARKLGELRKPVGGSTVAFRLAEKDLLTEGIAYDPESKAFFIGSVHRRKILRRAADGAFSEFVREGQDGLQAVLALRGDPRRRLLYACSAALPQMAGYEKALEGQSAVLAFSLDTGKLARRWELPRDGKPHAAGDLAISEDGAVYVSDSLGSAIYRIRPGAETIETFVPPGVFRSPQGLGFGPSGRLYAADWGQGLYCVEETGGRREISGPPDVPLYGIDGLLIEGRMIYVTQNGIEPHRVVRLELDASGERVVSGRILDMNDPEFAEPTLAVRVEDALYVIGKSQWGLFDEKTGAFDPGKLQEPTVLKVRIAP